jgi:hypothetical protein
MEIRRIIGQHQKVARQQLGVPILFSAQTITTVLTQPNFPDATLQLKGVSVEINL